LKLLNSAVEAFTALVLAFMTILVLLQVVYRYVLSIPFPESQELAVYAMVYIVTFGSTIAVYRKSHIAVNFVVDNCPPKLALIVRCIAYISLLVFFYLLVSEGWALTMRSMRQMSPTTGIPVGYIMGTIPVTAAISILYVLEQLYMDVKGFLSSKKE
ncbi:MAG: TRAP transporter small permease, partial [Burkholderiaceae bacterium]|nr:TRAP transporter small permease [Burkholderiaceae bacterium]